MHLYLESSNKSQSDCSISALSWMGKVPDDMPEEEGWKLNRVLYYQEGWLATGNARGIVGVTYTSSHSKKNAEIPCRSNYNLRGHRTEVTLVKWNEPYQKLATCDSSGIIFVWIKYEGRWSIELINDRNTPVTHFCWSHDGRMALICYQDGFVLVGSVAGQRYWSTMLTLQSTITAGTFTPDDQQVYFGTTSGLLIVMDVHGATVSQETLLDDTAISTLTWSCPKFKMEEGEDNANKNTSGSDLSSHLLAILFQTGLVYLLRSHDDVTPVILRTGLRGMHAEWTNSGELLAVGGFEPEEGCSAAGTTSCPLRNAIKFYTRNGTLRYTHHMPSSQHPITALTWGHNDKRVFVATGPNLYIGRVTRRVASLQLLCRLAIKTRLKEEDRVTRLPIPKRLRSLINSLYTQTIRCCVPDAHQLREFVSRPPSSNRRLHCTMIRHDEDLVPTPGACYTLYLEYLGGLVPLLKGKRTSKIRPEFVIYDPQADEEAEQKESTSYHKRTGSGVNNANGHLGTPMPNGHALSDSSDTEYEDMCASPRLQRRRKLRKRLRERLESEPDELIYLDTLPEQHRLVEVTSNIWGTKFKLHGVASSLPSNLGQVTYKTSLLHLQPRQMTLVITELRDDIPPRQDPNFNPNVFSEDEEETDCRTTRPPDLRTDVPPIAPMTPRRTPSCYSHKDLASPVPGPWDFPKTSTSTGTSFTEGEDHTYVDLGTPEMVRLRAELKVRNDNGGERSKLQAKSSSKGDTFKQHKKSPPTTRFISPEASSRSPSHSSNTFFNSKLNSLAGIGNNKSSFPASSNMAQPINSSVKHFSPNTSTITGLHRSNYTSSRGCHETLINTPGGVIRNDVIRYIDDESGDSEERSFTPSPSRMRPLNRSQRARSKSVGHLINYEAVPPSHLPPLSHHLHQLTSIEAFLAFRRSLSLKDCKKRHAVAEVERPRLIDFGKSHSLDSSLLMLNCKNLLLTETPPSNNQTSSTTTFDNNKYMSTLHSSPSRIHVIRNPLHSNHIYENINIYATSFGSSSFYSKENNNSIINSPKNNKNKHCSKHISTTSTPTRSHYLHNNINNNKIPTPCGGGNTTPTHCTTTSVDVPLGQTQSHHFGGGTLQVAPRTIENRFLRGLKEAVLGERLLSLQREYLSSSAHPHPPPTPKHVPSPEVSRRNQTSSTPSISPTHASKSTPPTPSKSRKHRRHQSSSPIRKHLLNSPLLARRRQRRGAVESSDEEVVHCSSDAEILCSSNNYRDLETFQKNQLKNKIRRTRGRENLGSVLTSNGSGTVNETNVVSAPRHRQFVMHNKAPLWNENSQVYQLDFGGRVTQESAKNFQIEFKGKQVMQFGRIDVNAYTLDFQYPFSAIQAFAVALANVTQRLK